jgi:hypothetical protein
MRSLLLAWAKSKPAVIQALCARCLPDGVRTTDGLNQNLTDWHKCEGQPLYALNQAGGVPDTAAEY